MAAAAGVRLEANVSTTMSGQVLVAEARRIGEQTAATWADEVDDQARFPSETVAELRRSGLLAALVPSARGRFRASMEEM
jgi:alkylation response protein AidB-like acyl-CoA dehydrogenase